jgi:hypothetical protein
MIVFSLLGYLDSTYSLDGNKLTITGTRYEGTIIVVVKKTQKRGVSSPYTGAVDVAAAPSAAAEGERPPVFSHRIFFSAASTEEYRFAVPFAPDELALLLQTEKTTLQLKIKPE